MEAMVVFRAEGVVYVLAALIIAVLVFFIFRAIAGKRKGEKSSDASNRPVNGLRRRYERRITRENAAAATRFRSAAAGRPHSTARGRRGVMSAVSRRNRRYNASLKAIDDYIGRQNGGGPADMLRFGLYRMRFNGCEVIAVYNLLHYLGGHRDIREIAEAFEKKGLPLLGSFGTTPDAIREYLEEVLREERKYEGIYADYKASAVMYPSEDAERYDDILEKAGSGILTFWNGERKWTIHTVMVCRMEKGGIRVYNQYTNVLYNEYASVDHFLRNQGRPYPPISLIVIER